MLTSANVSAKMAANYYEAENYYVSGETLAPAMWTGRFAKELGLEGKLEPHNFEQLLRGFGPSGAPLIANPELPYPQHARVSSEIQAKVIADLRLLSGLENQANHNRRLQNDLLEQLSKKMSSGKLKPKFIKSFEKKWLNTIEPQANSETTAATAKELRIQLKSILAPVSETTPRRAALDLTFSAPKSVSVQALVFGDSRLLQAHRESVATTMLYIEDHFAHCRVGPKIARQTHTTAKLAIAQLEHDLSREKDPHLHTHNIVMNLTPAFGKVRALHNDELFQNKRMIGTFYRNELALRVRSLGYDIELGKEGTFEISGFSREQIESFSQRHQQIWAQGRSNQAEVYERFQEKRKSKDKTIDRDELKQSWEKTALDLRMSSINSNPHEGIVLGSKPPSMADEVKSITEKNVILRRQDLQTKRLASNMGTVNSRKIIGACNDYATYSLIPTQLKNTFTTIEALRTEASYRKVVVDGIGIEKPLLSETDSDHLKFDLYRQNTLTIESKHKALQSSQSSMEKLALSLPIQEKISFNLNKSVVGNQKLSPRQLYSLRTEIEALLRQESGPKWSRKELSTTLRNVLDPFEKHMRAMTKGQINAIIGTASSCDKVILWQGVAGAGKTFSLAKTAGLMAEASFNVKGFAPSSAAAKQLASGANLETTTVDSFLLQKEMNQVDRVTRTRKREFWIVDEAGMLSAKQMERLMQKAATENARVLLVGDSKQLAAVAAGNPFLDLQGSTQTTKLLLSESVRQKTPNLQLAVHQMYAGKMEDAAHGLRPEVIEEPNIELRCKRAAASYLNLKKSDQSQTLLLAKTNEERRRITEHVRTGLKEKGQLQNETTLTVLRAIDFTELERTQSQNLSKGMVLVPNKSFSRQLSAGRAFVIDKIDLQKNKVTVLDEQGNERQIDCKQLKQASLYRQASLQVAVGDRILWSRNDRTAGFLNNDLFRVSKISDRGVMIESEEGSEPSGKIKRTLSPDSLHHLDHAWALTVHRAQGQTARNVILVSDNKLTTQEFLVGVTRATDDVVIVAQEREAVEKIGERDKVKEIGHEAIRQNNHCIEM